MTCCVAGLSDHRQTLVMIADKMIGTDSDQAEIGYKIRWVHKNWRILTAGKRDSTYKVVQLVKAALHHGESNPSVAVVERVVTDAYATVHKQAATNPHLRRYGLTIEQFKDRERQNPEDEIVKKIWKEIRRYHLDASLLVCGFAEKRGALFCVDGLDEPEHFTDKGFHAIGTGKSRALSVLHYHGFKTTLSLRDALCFVFQAKAWAEGARGVGRKTDIVVLRFNQKGASLAKGEVDNLREIWKQTRIKKLNVVDEETLDDFDRTVERLSGGQNPLLVRRFPRCRESRIHIARAKVPL